MRYLLKLTIWLMIRCIPEIKWMCPSKQCSWSLIYKSELIETTQVSINRRMEKWDASKLSCIELKALDLSSPTSTIHWHWPWKGWDQGQVALFSQGQFPKRDWAESCQPPNVLSPRKVNFCPEGKIRASGQRATASTVPYWVRDQVREVLWLPGIPRNPWKSVQLFAVGNQKKLWAKLIMYIFYIRNKKMNYFFNNYPL